MMREFNSHLRSQAAFKLLLGATILSSPVVADQRDANKVNVLAETASGRTVAIYKPDAKDANTAVRSALVDVEKMLGTKPVVKGAFADQKQPANGGARFEAVVNGYAVGGMILCGPAKDGGELITIIYARSDAPAAEWDKLNAALPSTPKMARHEFPDGTGSIDLPEGWTTQNQSVIGGVRVTGPNDSVVSLGVGISVVTPNSMAVQNQRQMEMNARQWGMQAPPPLLLLVAPFTGPVDAVKNLTPQISNLSQRNGGPAVKLVKILDSKDAPPTLPGSHAATMTYLIDKTSDATSARYKAMAKIETYALGDGSQSWGLFLTEVAGQEQNFEKDLPTMLAIARSAKTNDEVIAAKTQQMIAQQNQNFAAQQKAHREQQEAFDSYIKSQERNSVIRDRSAADFDEVIRGYRTMEDTRTGEHTSQNLGDIHEMVEKLNEAYPGRYKEIPLRDEVAPLPEQK